jgi:hypothetical protein
VTLFPRPQMLTADGSPVMPRFRRHPILLPHGEAHPRSALNHPGSLRAAKSELDSSSVMAFCLRPRLVLGQNSGTSFSNQNRPISLEHV